MKRSKTFLDFYSKIVDRFFILPFSTDLDSQLNQFAQYLVPCTTFMLQGRFEPSAPSKSKRKSLRDLPHSDDLAILLEVPDIGVQVPKRKKGVIDAPDPLDIIKGYKLLEYQALSGQTATEGQWSDLNLGEYKVSFESAADSLSTLLISISSISKDQAEQALTQILSLICVYRCFKVKAKASDKTITAPYSGSKPLETVIDTYFSDERIDAFLSKFVDKSKLGNFDELFIYSGNASSPNGGHSSVNYLADIAALMTNQPLLQNIFGMISHFKFGSELRTIVEILMVNIDKDYLNGKEHSRLVTFTAPGGKSRIIAVVDWLSQTALSAIHKTQFRLLAMIPSDRTYDHTKGLDLYDPNAQCYHSVDLSAATDRLPRALQSRLISRTFTMLGLDGASIAAHWDVIVDREYSTKNSLLEKVAPRMRYSVGQGMGLFSSWSSMALVHHYIVRELCSIPFDRYVLVGDDLLLKDSDLEYQDYLRIMTEIGVHVNPAKTLISRKQPHSLEFARNFIVMGHRCRPMPLGSIFAFIDNKIGSLEAFCSFTPVLRHVSVANLLSYLKIKDALTLTDIAYFIVKEKILAYEAAAELLKMFDVKLIITQNQIDHIARIVSNKVSKPARLTTTKLTQTLQSQCTIVRDDDMEKLSSLALDFSVLKFAGEEIEDYSQVMHDRMNNAKLIEYDHDFATATVSKREHRLIRDLMVTIEMMNKDIRAGRRRIK
jgi:hypothetical protein